MTIDYPSGVTNTTPTFLVGGDAGASVPSKAACSTAGLAILAGADDAAQRLSMNAAIKGVNNDITRLATLTGGMLMTEQSAPATPAATTVEHYLASSNGFPRLAMADEFGVTTVFGRDVTYVCVNGTASIIPRGTPVYATGVDGAGVIQVAPAINTDKDQCQSLGLALDQMAAGAAGYGRIMSIGTLSNCDTSALTLGAPVYIDGAGALTSTKPTAYNTFVVRVGFVRVVHATAGVLEVRVTTPVKQRLFTLRSVIDGGGSVPGTGSKGYLRVEEDCTLVSATMLADQSGSAIVDVKKGTYSGFPTTASIAGGSPLTITSAQKYNDPTLSGWTKGLSAGDILEFNLNSVTTISRLNIDFLAVGVS